MAKPAGLSASLVSGVLASSASALSGPGQCGWHSELASLPDKDFVPA